MRAVDMAGSVLAESGEGPMGSLKGVAESTFMAIPAAYRKEFFQSAARSLSSIVAGTYATPEREFAVESDISTVRVKAFLGTGRTPILVEFAPSADKTWGTVALVIVGSKGNAKSNTEAFDDDVSSDRIVNWVTLTIATFMKSR